jgi:hypothetical protein
LKSTLIAKSGEMRKLAFCQHGGRQGMIETIQPKNDNTLNLALAGGCFPKKVRKNNRMGHVNNITTAEKIAPNNARNEPARAKPAPGPT